MGYGGWTICEPCLNGTARAALTPGGCYACPLNGTHAPWLGMEACVCQPGLYPVMDDNGSVLVACVATAVGGSFSYYAELASPLVVVPVCAVCGVLAILAGVVCSM